MNKDWFTINKKPKSILIQLGLTAVASVADVDIRKKIFGLRKIILVIPKEEKEGIMKIVKSL